MIEITEHRVAVPYLPEALRGLRVVQLTDLHRGKFTSDRLLRDAVAVANATCPDLILLTGDFVISDPADVTPCAHILASLRSRLGVYAILGNHDHWTDARGMERALTHIGVTVLTNQNVRLENGLRLVGIEDERLGKPDVPRAFAGIGNDEPVLVLVHNPAIAERLASHACVAFAGHTHGGQIHLPLLTAREVRRIGAKHYRAGWYTIGNAKLYVNRGVGQVGLPFRFRCHSEVAIFTLEPDLNHKDTKTQSPLE